MKPIRRFVHPVYDPPRGWPGMVVFLVPNETRAALKLRYPVEVIEGLDAHPVIIIGQHAYCRRSGWETLKAAIPMREGQQMIAPLEEISTGLNGHDRRREDHD